MKMKNLFRSAGALALSAVLLASCSQDEGSAPGAGRAIGFRAQGVLKATGTTAGYISSFVVNAHHCDDTGWATYLLKGTTVYRGEGGGNNWAYSPLAYFPANDPNDKYVEFFAYSPSGSSRMTTKLGDASDENQTIGYTVPVPSADAKGVTTQEDLLVSYGRVEKAGYGNTVPLQFRHALSRILVAARTPEPGVTITGLTLKNLMPSGNLPLKGNSADKDTPSAGIPWSASSDLDAHPVSWVYKGTPAAAGDYVTLWTTAGTAQDYPYVLPASGVSVGKSLGMVTSVEQGMYCIPQQTTGNGDDTWDSGEFGLQVNYILNDGLSYEKTLAFKDINGIANAGPTFEIGRQYVLNIEITARGIKFAGIDVDDYNMPSITATADPVAGGTVTGSGTYNAGTSVNLEAIADTGYEFEGWYEGTAPVSDQNPYTFTVTGDRTLTAKFVFDDPNTGLVINGTRWAKYNVAAPQTFATSETDLGLLYNWGSAAVGWSTSDPMFSSPTGQAWPSSYHHEQSWDMSNENPCPSGWRVPTPAQLQELVNAYIGKVPDGFAFQDEGGHTLTFPAPGSRNNTQNREWVGSMLIWGAESDPTNDWHASHVICRQSNGSIAYSIGGRKGDALSVRCVKP